MWIISGIMELSMGNDDASVLCLPSFKTAKQWRHKNGQKNEKYDERINVNIFSKVYTIGITQLIRSILTEIL